jgi:hypothetical protein
MARASLSRPQRWSLACDEAAAALQKLIDLQEEYEIWSNFQPENLVNSPTTDRLDEVTSLEFDKALQTVHRAKEIELPKGYGRD